MNANPILLQKKYSRVIECFADKMNISLNAALDFFYRSEVYCLMRDGVSDMHCMSDEYLADELVLEYKESDIRKDVNDMCNLSQGIKEQAYVEGTENGIAIGKQEGITIGKREGIAETIIKMYRKGYEVEQISDILDMEVEEVREIIENE